MKNVKRLQKEMLENETPAQYFYIQPLPNDLLTWHFTFIGPEDTDYEGGLYHGYFSLPADYPLSPPDIYYLNESGRYQPNTKICLTITSYHKSDWTPAWSLRTMMEAANAYFVVDGDGIASMITSKEERKAFAKKSRDFKCSHCGYISDIEKKILNGRKQTK